MKSNTTIHEIDISQQSCIITLYDCDGNLIFDHINIGIELNPDGTINNQAIEQKIKKHVLVFQGLNNNPEI
jgi:hypothetical protein